MHKMYIYMCTYTGSANKNTIRSLQSQVSSHPGTRRISSRFLAAKHTISSHRIGSLFFFFSAYNSYFLSDNKRSKGKCDEDSSLGVSPCTLHVVKKGKITTNESMILTFIAPNQTFAKKQENKMHRNSDSTWKKGYLHVTYL